MRSYDEVTYALFVLKNTKKEKIPATMANTKIKSHFDMVIFEKIEL